MIKQWQPWKQPTGLRTPEGKAVSSQNGNKPNSASNLLKEIRQYLKQHKELLNQV